jgi:uncharacterized protein
MNNYYGQSWAEGSRPSDVLSTSITNAFLQRVFISMAAGLAITGLVAYLFASAAFIFDQGQLIGINPAFEWAFMGLGRWVVMLAPFAFVLVLSFGIHKLSYPVAVTLFGLFAAVMGMSLSAIFAVYTGSSIAMTFFITAGSFAALAIYGMTTKADLSKLGSIAMMGLFGIIIASIVNWFMQSETMSYIISIFGVLIFTALTAYDVQRIMRESLTTDADTDDAKKRSIMGALTLYLDFINLFLFLLRLLGSRR